VFDPLSPSELPYFYVALDQQGAKRILWKWFCFCLSWRDFSPQNHQENPISNRTGQDTFEEMGQRCNKLATMGEIITN